MNNAYVLYGSVDYEGDHVIAYYLGKPSLAQLQSHFELQLMPISLLETLHQTGEVAYRNGTEYHLEKIEFIQGAGE